MRKLDRRARKLLCEQLESRCLLSAFAGGSEFHAVIVAGDLNGSPTDSPSSRVDPNLTTSPFAGVGSLQITANRGTYICTATPIDATHVLTAGHCVDLNDDGKSDKRDGIRSIAFNLNYGGNLTSQIAASSWTVNPDFTGFNRPSVSDDLTVITLSNSLPAGVPIYALANSDMVAGTTHLYMVGYGQSGDGVNGYTVSPSFSVKRHGENIADAFYAQDDTRPTTSAKGANEVFRFDFDGQTGNGSFGGPTLGNNLETTLGGGDSGGPSFVLIPGDDPAFATSYQLAGVNTFTQGTNAPKFGSLGGGINVFPYESWINSVVSGATSSSGTGGGGGGGGGANSSFGAIDVSALVAPPADSGLAEAESHDYVAGSVAVPSPSAQSAVLIDVHADQSQSASPLDPAQASAARGKHDLLDIAADASGIADDAETDDFAPAVDEVLRRWSC